MTRYEHYDNDPTHASKPLSGSSSSTGSEAAGSSTVLDAGALEAELTWDVLSMAPVSEAGALEAGLTL